jgi:hypothetical protein
LSFFKRFKSVILSATTTLAILAALALFMGAGATDDVEPPTAYQYSMLVPATVLLSSPPALQPGAPTADDPETACVVPDGFANDYCDLPINPTSSNVPKDPTQDAYAQGNAGDGGGPNVVMSKMGKTSSDDSITQASLAHLTTSVNPSYFANQRASSVHTMAEPATASFDQQAEPHRDQLIWFVVILWIGAIVIVALISWIKESDLP